MENMSSSHKITSVLIEITFLKQNEKLPYNYQEKDCTKYLVNKQCEIVKQASPIKHYDYI